MDTNNINCDINNKAILMRKSLKSIINQTRLNLAKRIKKLKQSKKVIDITRKESELECFKRIKVSDIQLSLGVNPESLKKTLSTPTASEREKVLSRVLLNPLLQNPISELKLKYGEEAVGKFLKENEENIQKNIDQRSNKTKSKPKRSASVSESEASSPEADDENEVEIDGDKEPIDLLATDVPKVAKVVKEKKTKEPRKESQPLKKKSRREVTEVKKSVDPFFFSSSGDNYCAVTAAASSDSEEERFVRRDPQPNRMMPMARKPIHSKPFVVAPFAPRAETLSVANVNPKPATATLETIDEAIHPSWKAKAQMRKTLIQDFKGTKIKFDD